MPLNLASPGIVVREVDLTVGRVDATSGAVGALVAPFAKGPVDVPVLVGDEADLLKNFGEPYSTDKHYEHWMVASSYLAYGGDLQVVRADDNALTNAFVGSASSIKIKSTEHYGQLGYQENTISGVTFAARNPGSWANGVRVATIDAKADQIIAGVQTSGTVPTISVLLLHHTHFRLKFCLTYPLLEQRLQLTTNLLVFMLSQHLVRLLSTPLVRQRQ